MVLGFKTKFPNGKPTEFVEQILLGAKIHTMRLGSRWREGMRIQMATGVRTKRYQQFNKNLPELWFCKATQDFKFTSEGGIIELWIETTDGWRRMVCGSTLASLVALQDGLSNADALFEWFTPALKASASGEIHGQIIHWTSFKY
jgi:hypothetical protein